MNFNEWINYLHVHDNTTRGGVAPLSSLYVPPLTTAGIKLWAYLVVTCGLCGWNENRIIPCTYYDQLIIQPTTIANGPIKARLATSTRSGASVKGARDALHIDLGAILSLLCTHRSE